MIWGHDMEFPKNTFKWTLNRGTLSRQTHLNKICNSKQCVGIQEVVDKYLEKYD